MTVGVLWVASEESILVLGHLLFERLVDLAHFCLCSIDVCGSWINRCTFSYHLSVENNEHVSSSRLVEHLVAMLQAQSC